MDRPTLYFSILGLFYIFGAVFEAIYHTLVLIPLTKYVIGWQDALLANVLAGGIALILAWHFYEQRDIPNAPRL
jgi:hypothetical protein